MLAAGTRQRALRTKRGEDLEAMPEAKKPKQAEKLRKQFLSKKSDGVETNATSSCTLPFG